MVGEGEKYASAIVSPNFEALKNWARENGIHTNDKSALIQEKKLLDLFHQLSAQFNKSLGSDEKLKRIKIVADEWSVASGELSPTLKLKRKVLMKKYEALISELFNHETAQS